MSLQLSQPVGAVAMKNPFEAAGPFFAELQSNLQNAFPKGNKPKKVHFRPAFASMSMSAFTLVDTDAKPADRKRIMPQETATIAAAPAKAPAKTQEKKEKKVLSLGEIINNAGKKALSGGIPGMAAMALQVLSLMWLRTTVNYQYRNGTSMAVALKTLYAEGGIPRFYRGLAPALVQGPLSRFGDTAANAGALAFLEAYEPTANLPVGVKTLAASLAAGCFRIFLMPVDAMKTIMQVEGKNGMAALAGKLRVGGPSVLFHGALAASAATFVGHYPWFAVYNFMNEALPKFDDLPRRLGRSAVIGFCASAVSDTCSNSIRVIKTVRQTSTTPMTYAQCVKSVIEKDGLSGLFGRGLQTKIISNGIQGLMFSVLWRLGQDAMAKHEKEQEAKKAAEAKAKAK